MSKQEFIILCVKYTVEPSIALENPDLCDALRSRDEEEVERILSEEF
jgi:hypothetical protein